MGRRRRPSWEPDYGWLEELEGGVAAPESLVAALGEFPAQSVQRGNAYYAEGRVEGLDAWGVGAFATVRGQQPYVVEWICGNGEWMAACSCPVGVLCKHAFAAGLALLVLELPALPAEYAHWVDALMRTGRSEGGLFAGLDPTARPPADSPADRRAIETLRSSSLVSLRRAALSQLLEGGPVHGHLVYEVDGELNEDDPDLRCLRLALAIQLRSGEWVPPDLRSYLERPELLRRLQDRLREEARRRLVGWLDRGDSPKRRFRAVLSFERGYQGEAGLVVTPLVTSARLDSAPRTLEQVRQALSESYARGATTALQRRLLTWLVRGLSDGGSYPYTVNANRMNGWMLRSVNWFRESGLVTWAEDIDPAMAERGGISPGTSALYSAEAMALEPECTTGPGGNVRMRLSYRCRDGTRRPLSKCLPLEMRDSVHGETESFVVSEGIVHDAICELPDDVVAAFEGVGEIEVDADERDSVLGRLARRVPSIETDLSRHTRYHPVVPTVALELRDDDRLAIRMFAASPAANWAPVEPVSDGIVFEYGGATGWQRLSDGRPSRSYGPIQTGDATNQRPGESDTPTQPDDVWRDAPRASDVAPAVEWLEMLEARWTRDTPEGPENGWWLRARGKAMTRFAEAWEAAPPGVRFYGNEAARRLLDRGRRVTPKLQIDASGIDWLEVSASWEAEGISLSDEDVAALRKATSTFVRLPSGWVRRDAVGEHEEVASVLADLGIEAGAGPARMSVFALAGASADTLAALQSFDADESTVAAVRELREKVAAFRGVPRVRVPRRFRGKLRPYQRDGLDFLAFASEMGVGCVLADDMGLGKTVQTLAWLQWLRDSDPQGGPALIVCPASVTHNWVAEASEFTPRLKAVTLGSGKGRGELLREVERFDLVVTNYALLRRDAPIWREKKLRALVLDEAQNVKNPDAAITRTVGSIEARHRVALTGTPIENRAMDLWSIVDCINPGYLGTRADFGSRFDGLDVPRHRRTVLAAKLRPILLRRTKAEVAPDLPERIEESRHCELTKGQREIYLAELAKSRDLVADLDAEPGSLRRNKISILAALTRLRQVCCHPALVGGLESLGSGKFDGFFELLEPLLDEGHKVLVFSQFVECLKLLRTQLRDKGIRVHVLTGKTTKRSKVVRDFHDDPSPSVFLVSLKAGGTGLNLTSASYVVLFDPWWNPAVEAQAIDRTHRIGQDKTIIAYRLIAKGTIEEKIRELQRRKEGLVRDVLGEGGFARSLSRADLDYLLESP